MKILRYLTILFFALILTSPVRAQKDITVEHYRISPAGNYQYITLVPRQQLDALGESCGNSVDPGTIYYTDENSQDSNSLFFCAPDEESASWTWAFPSGIWSALPENLAPNETSATAVTFENDSDTTSYTGIGTTDPEFTLSLIDKGGILAKGTETDIPDTQAGQPFYNIFYVKENLDAFHKTSSSFPLFWWYAQKGAFRAQNMSKDDTATDYDDLWDQNSSKEYQANDGHIGYYSTALGDSNIAAGRASFAGGSHNQAWDPLSSILSGKDNIIQTPLKNSGNTDHLKQRFGSTIIGGFENKIIGPRSLIAGGRENSILYANSCAIGGGYNNLISDYDPDGALLDNELFNYNPAAGGLQSMTNETHSIILGGYNNHNYGRRTLIGGGYENTILNGAQYSAVISGKGSRIGANTSHSVILGGSGDNTGSDGRLENNILAGNFSVVLASGEGPQTSGTSRPVTSNHSFLVRPGGTFTHGTQSLDSDYIVSLGAADSFLGHHSVALTNHHPSDVQVSVNADYASALGGGISAKILSGSDYSVAVNKGPHISMSNAQYSLATSTGTDTGSSMTGDYSVAHGGKSSGDYSYTFTQFPGGCDRHRNNADRSFLFGICPPQDLNTDNRFIIYAKYSHGSGWPNYRELRMGIGETDPEKTLEVNGTLRTESLKIEEADLPSGPGDHRDLFRDHSTGQVFRNDIAEIFPAHEALKPGELVSISPSRPEKLTKSSQANDPFVIGVVSSAPAVVFEGSRVIIAPGIPAQHSTTRPHIALAGRTVIKVCLENGPVKRGDLLTASSIPGVAMKAGNTPQARNTIVAKALENFTGHNGDTGTVTGLVIVR